MNLVEQLADDRIRFYENLVMPYFDSFSDSEKAEIESRFEYLNALKSDPELVYREIPESRFGEDVLILNQFLRASILGVKTSPEDDTRLCEVEDWRNLSPPVFWNYPLILELDREVAVRMINNYVICVAKSDDLDDRVLIVTGQLLPFLDFSDIHRNDLVQVLFWSLGVLNYLDQMGEEGESILLERRPRFLSLVENLWYFDQNVFYPFFQCIGGTDFIPSDIELEAVFGESRLSSICSSGGGERLLEAAENFDFLSGILDAQLVK